jgi:hypothetical protein
VVRPGFKPGRGRQSFPGRFDSGCFPPFGPASFVLQRAAMSAETANCVRHLAATFSASRLVLHLRKPCFKHHENETSPHLRRLLPGPSCGLWRQGLHQYTSRNPGCNCTRHDDASAYRFDFTLDRSSERTRSGQEQGSDDRGAGSRCRRRRLGGYRPLAEEMTLSGGPTGRRQIHRGNQLPGRWVGATDIPYNASMPITWPMDTPGSPDSIRAIVCTWTPRRVAEVP